MTKPANKETRIKGKGWFVNEHGIIYVQGSVKGSGFKRRSTGMPWNKKNEAYVKRHARDLLIEILEEEKGGSAQLTDFTTFGRRVIEAGAKRPGKRGGRGEYAQRDAVSKYDRLIAPRFGRYSLEDIRVADVEAWVDGLLEQYSTSTVSKCINLLREIMHKAVANDIIVKNPVEYIDPIEVTHVKQSAYSVDDARRLMSESDGWMHRYLNLAFTTGMRTGEMLALRWDDIDWERGVIYLQRSVTKGVISIGTNGHKNHNRVIPVMPSVMEILRRDRAESVSPWVFPNTRGQMYTESKSIVARKFKPLLEKLGIEYISLYATRHTFATIAANLEVAPEALNAIVGNSEQVRRDHYVTFEVTDARAAHAHTALQPVNTLFFGQKEEEKIG